jgi:hypothetical protein
MRGVFTDLYNKWYYCSLGTHENRNVNLYRESGRRSYFIARPQILLSYATSQIIQVGIFFHQLTTALRVYSYCVNRRVEINVYVQNYPKVSLTLNRPANPIKIVIIKTTFPMLLLDSLWSWQTWIAQLLTHGQLRTEIDSRGLANYMYKCTFTCFMRTSFLLNVFSVFRLSPFTCLMLFLCNGIG